MSEPITPIVEVVELPEKRYEYQPTDEQGRPLGGKQVIVYKTQDELVEKLTTNQVELIRKLRTVTREQRLGIKPNESIPNDAERFDGVVEFKPRELSATERFEISQQLNDPEKFTDARDRLLESAVGVNPTKLTETLNQQQLYILQMRARDNYIDFVNSGVEYADIPDNRQVMTDWMFKNKLAPTVKNFNLAHSKLKEAGLLLEASVVQQIPMPTPAPATPVVAPVVEPVDGGEPAAPAVPASRIASDVQPQAKRQSHVPSGLNDRVSSPSGVEAVDGPSLTLADIDRIPSDKLKGMLNSNKAFRTHYDKLLTEAETRRRQKVAAQV